jgi:hypothetical protein
VVVVGLLALVLAGCGDDGGGDAELERLLEDEAGQSASTAECIAEELDGNDDVDQDELEAIIRGEGSTDLDTADAYAGAVIECADLSDLLSS